MQIDNRADQRVPISILIASLLFLLLVQGYPFIWSIVVSLKNQRIGGGGVFVGLGNYVYPDKIRSILACDCFYVFICNTGDYIQAHFRVYHGDGSESAAERGGLFFELCCFFPWALPTLTSVMAWRWMLGDIGGIFNYPSDSDRSD